jgi:hypothetical protein
MDWTVELHPDDGGDAQMIDLPNSLAPLASMPKCSLPMRNALR